MFIILGNVSKTQNYVNKKLRPTDKMRTYKDTWKN